MKDEHNFRLKFEGDPLGEQAMSDKELLYFFSSGTTKGMLLYTFVAASVNYEDLMKLKKELMRA